MLTTVTMSYDVYVGRYFAYRAVVDAEKAAIIENLSAGKKDRSVSNEFVELHAKLLFDETVNAGARASVLREGEVSEPESH